MGSGSRADLSYMGLYVSMVIYLAGLLLVACLAWHGRRRAAGEDGLLAAQYGGSFHPAILVLTTFASVFSGYTVTGVPSEAAVMGFFAVRWVAEGPAIALGFLLFYPRLRRLSVTRKYRSPNDFIADRFRSEALRLLSSLCTCLPQLLYLAAQLVTFSSLVFDYSQDTIPKWAGMLILAVIVFAMESVGGMRSVVFSDALQAGLMIAGFVLMLIVLSLRYGTLWAMAPEDCPTLGFVNSTSLSMLRATGDHFATPAICSGSVTAECRAYGCVAAAEPGFFRYPERAQQASFFFFVANLVAFPLNPHMVQRVYIATSDDALRLVTAVIAVAGICVMLPGIAAGVTKATYGPSWPLASQESTAFASIGEELMMAGPGEYFIVAVLTTSVLAAVMSTTDSLLLGVANTFSVDFYESLVPDASQQGTVRFGSMITVLMLGGGMALGVGLSPRTFGHMLLIQNGILLQIFPGYLLGLHTEVSTRAVLSGVLAGISAFFASFVYNPLTAYVPEPNIGALVNFATVALVQAAEQFLWAEEACGNRRAELRFGQRLTLAGINEAMGSTREPSGFCIGAAVLCLVASTPIYGRPGAEEHVVIAGLPRWAFLVLVLQVAASIACVAATYTWRSDGPPVASDKMPEGGDLMGFIRDEAALWASTSSGEESDSGSSEATGSGDSVDGEKGCA